jgi:hypothetical protein
MSSEKSKEWVYKNSLDYCATSESKEKSKQKMKEKSLWIGPYAYIIMMQRLQHNFHY